MVECSTATVTPTPLPTLPPQADNNEWSQHGRDPQHTSYSPVNIPTPWKYAWQWNGADANGKRQANHLSVPRNVQPITGGGRVYIVADNSVIALQQSTGTELWKTSSIGTLQSSAAYVGEAVYVGSSDGKLYKLDAASGQILGSFSTSGAIIAPPLLANNQIGSSED